MLVYGAVSVRPTGLRVFELRVLCLPGLWSGFVCVVMAYEGAYHTFHAFMAFVSGAQMITIVMMMMIVMITISIALSVLSSYPLSW